MEREDVGEREQPESCPLCGEDVIPATLHRETGVPWGSHHQAHALCALENLAARVSVVEQTCRLLEEALERVAGRPPRWIGGR